jgi:hypothetical protein
MGGWQMSTTVTTPLGVFRHLPTSDGEPAWFMECQTCGGFEKLALEQLEGRTSVNHAATGCPSGYHETHDYATVIRAAGGDV